MTHSCKYDDNNKQAANLRLLYATIKSLFFQQLHMANLTLFKFFVRFI